MTKKKKKEMRSEPRRKPHLVNTTKTSCEQKDTENLTTPPYTNSKNCNRHMLENHSNFIAFLVVNIQNTILSQTRSKTVDILKIITESAEKYMGIPIDIDYIKTLI